MNLFSFNSIYLWKEMQSHDCEVIIVKACSFTACSPSFTPVWVLLVLLVNVISSADRLFFTWSVSDLLRTIEQHTALWHEITWNNTHDSSRVTHYVTFLSRLQRWFYFSSLESVSATRRVQEHTSMISCVSDTQKMLTRLALHLCWTKLWLFFILNNKRCS